MAEKKIAKTVKKTVKKAEARAQELKGKISPARAKVNANKLEMLVTIVPSNKAEFYTDLLQSMFEVNFQCTSRARGTANAQMLSLAGFTDQNKTVIFSVIKEDKVKDAMATLEDKFNTIKKGKGVAFTVPLSSVIGVAVFGFLSNDLRTVKEDKQ